MPLQLLPNVPQSTLMPSSFDSIPTLAPQFIDPFDAAAAVPINDPNFNRGVLMMTTPSIFGAVQWYRPDSMPEPLFAASGGYPVWRLDAHEIAYARVSFPNISTCRYNVLLQALPTGCPSVAQFLPFPRTPGSMWDPVVSPDGSRMAFLRVNNYSTRVDVIVRNLNDTQGTSEVNLTVSLPASTIAVIPPGHRRVIASPSRRGQVARIFACMSTILRSAGHRRRSRRRDSPCRCGRTTAAPSRQRRSMAALSSNIRSEHRVMSRSIRHPARNGGAYLCPIWAAPANMPI